MQANDRPRLGPFLNPGTSAKRSLRPPRVTAQAAGKSRKAATDPGDPMTHLRLPGISSEAFTGRMMSMGMWVAIGTSIGIGIGAAMDNISMGATMGVAMGAALSAVLSGTSWDRDDDRKP